MSKITDALKKASQDRTNTINQVQEHQKNWNNHQMEGSMKKIWIVWIVIAAVVGVFFSLNYKGSKDAVPLAEIFPEEEIFPVNVEYEFVDDEGAVPQSTGDLGAVKPTSTPVSAKESVPAVSSLAAVSATKSVAKTVTPTQTVSPDKANGMYIIQIASFKEKKRAEEALEKIRVKVPTAYIVTRDLGEKGVWYRIYGGQYSQRSEAELSLGTIKQSFDSSFIIAPKK